MAIAVLECKFDNNDIDNTITLDSGSLRQIDNITKDFKDEEEIKNNSIYRDKIKSYMENHDNSDSEIKLSYIKNNNEKINLDIIYDDHENIRTRTSALEEVKSEVERSRKLLLNSKNRIFLTLFLLNKNLKSTTYSTVKITLDEFKIAKEQGLNVLVQNGEYRIPIADVLKYRLNNKRLGAMRLLVEDTLEVWKKNVMSSSDEDLYFYSRELRLLINEYNYRKIPRRVVYNLVLNKKPMQILKSRISINRNNEITTSNILGLPKKKVLEERKIA